MVVWCCVGSHGSCAFGDAQALSAVLSGFKNQKTKTKPWKKIPHKHKHIFPRFPLRMLSEADFSQTGAPSAAAPFG